MLPAITWPPLEHSSFYIGTLLHLLSAVISSGDAKVFRASQHGQSHISVWNTYLDEAPGGHKDKIPAVLHDDLPEPEIPEILRRMQRQVPPLHSDDSDVFLRVRRQSRLPTPNSTWPNLNSTLPTPNSTWPNLNSTLPTPNSTWPNLNSTLPTPNPTRPTPWIFSEDEDEYDGGSGFSNLTEGTLINTIPESEWISCGDYDMVRCPFEEKCAYLCDRSEECYGGSDEMDEFCSLETPTSRSWLPCGNRQYFCLSEFDKCGFLCDGRVDCKDGSDESEEACSFINKECPSGNHTILNSTVELNVTKPGYYVSVDCPGDTRNIGIWHCNYDGKWKKPDLIPCGKSADFFLPPGDTKSSSVVDNVTAAARTMRQQQLWPRDILDILSGLEEIQKQYQLEIWDGGADAPSLSERYMEGVLNVTSTLLQQYESWKYMPVEIARSSSSSLQKAIVDAALTKAIILDSSTVLEYSSEQIGIRISSLTREEFDRKENRFYGHKLFRDTSILLPKEFYKYVHEGMERITVVFNSFDYLHCLTNDIPCVTEDLPDEDLVVDSKGQVNSGVIGATVGFGPGWRATGDEYVEIKFSHIYNGVKLTMKNVKCVWWDTQRHMWSPFGCKLVDTNRFHTTCHCIHLTNLAVIMDLRGVLNRGSIIWKVLEWITIIGCSLSILFLAIGIVGFLLLKIAREKKKSSVGAKKYQIRLHLCACLLLAELVLLAGLNATSNKIACSFVAALLHFFFLATFAWSAIEAVNLYLAMMKVFDSEISQKHFIIAGYGIPLALVIMTLAISRAKGYGSRDVCWLAPNGIIWSFAGTLAVIMLVNIIAFVMVMRVVWKERSVGNTSGGSSKPKIRKVIGSIAIFLVLGLTWITGFFFFSEGSKPLAIVFTLLNSIQGVCIVLFGIFLEADVRKELIQIISEKFQMKKVPVDGNTNNTNPGNAPSGTDGSQVSSGTTSKNQTETTGC